MTTSPLNPPFELSTAAFNELRQLLKNELGEEQLKSYTKADIDYIGYFLLTYAKISLKIQMREYKRGAIHQ